jgi:hypothetical protein
MQTIDQHKVFSRLLETPAAQKIAAEIAAEKAEARAKIERRIAEIEAERVKAIKAAEPSHRAAKERFEAAKKAVPIAATQMSKAFGELQRARSLHGVELARLRRELEASE